MNINYDYIEKEVPTNFVPAVAVIRRELALFKMIGRKRFVGGILFFNLNLNLNFNIAVKLKYLLEYNRG